MHVSLAEPVRGPGTPMAQREPEHRHGHLEAVVLLVADRAEQGEVDVGDRKAEHLDHGSGCVAGDAVPAPRTNPDLRLDFVGLRPLGLPAHREVVSGDPVAAAVRVEQVARHELAHRDRGRARQLERDGAAPPAGERADPAVVEAVPGKEALAGEDAERVRADVALPDRLDEGVGLVALPLLLPVSGRTRRGLGKLALGVDDPGETSWSSVTRACSSPAISATSCSSSSGATSAAASDGQSAANTRLTASTSIALCLSISPPRALTSAGAVR